MTSFEQEICGLKKKEKSQMYSNQRVEEKFEKNGEWWKNRKNFKL